RRPGERRVRARLDARRQCLRGAPDESLPRGPRAAPARAGHPGPAVRHAVLGRDRAAAAGPAPADPAAGVRGRRAARPRTRRLRTRRVESGPAAGALAAARAARDRGETRLLSFDMGGTT